MILVTGGLGFIGRQTTRALLDLGESCVVAQRGGGGVPEDFAGDRLVVEQVDVVDRAALLEIGTRQEITGIVHLAGSVPWPPGAYEPVDGARRSVESLLNVFEAAREWKVARVGVASTIGVYGGVGAGLMREDVALPMTAGHAIPAFKKIGELVGDYLADTAGFEVVNYRIGAIWGPRGRAASPFIAAPQLVHAAVRGVPPDLSALPGPAYLDDGSDLCYVKDCGRAIARLQLADRLNHRTYNVASGRLTTNREVVAAIEKVLGTRFDLPEGHGPVPDVYLDITRLHEGTGYLPEYDTERAVADYADWLRSGHDR